MIQNGNFIIGPKLTVSLFLSRPVFPNGQLQNQILLNGWTVWLEPGGKKNKGKGMLYPVGVPTAKIPRDPGLFVVMIYGFDLGLKRETISKEEMLLIGFYSGKQDDVVRAALTNPSGFAVKANMTDEEELQYEVKGSPGSTGWSKKISLALGNRGIRTARTNRK